MNLDIKTPKGQQSRLHEQTVIKRILSTFPGIQIIETDKDKPAALDVILCRKNTITGVGEIKCRDYTYQQLKDLGNTVLITFDKIQDGADIANLLKCPFFLFVYLIPDNKIHYWKITDENGVPLFPFETKHFKTPKTINGGQITRLNALIDFKYQTGIL